MIQWQKLASVTVYCCTGGGDELSHYWQIVLQGRKTPFLIVLLHTHLTILLYGLVINLTPLSLPPPRVVAAGT